MDDYKRDKNKLNNFPKNLNFIINNTQLEKSARFYFLV